MTEKEMTNRVNEIIDYVFTDKNANTYSELMAADYNLWAFLRYDANCEYPTFEPPTEGHFEF
nr:hypothetical protein [uncultured Dysosmobacter sp.]